MRLLIIISTFILCHFEGTCINTELYLDSVRAVVEKSNASNGAEDGVRGVIHHIVSGHWRQRLSLK